MTDCREGTDPTFFGVKKGLVYLPGSRKTSSVFMNGKRKPRSNPLKTMMVVVVQILLHYA